MRTPFILTLLLLTAAGNGCGSGNPEASPAPSPGSEGEPAMQALLFENRETLSLRPYRGRVVAIASGTIGCEHSQEMFERDYGVTEAHPNCLDNLADNLEPYGVRLDQITIPFNIFMNIEISDDGEIEIQPPHSKAGDAIVLRAEMDLIVGVTACSAGMCNNYKCTPIEVELYSEAAEL